MLEELVELTTELLVPQEKYLESGIHIGTKLKTGDMKPFIYKTRQDRLYVLDLKKVDERIRYAAKFMQRFNPKEVVVVASRTYAVNAAKVFCSLTGCRIRAERFVPGLFTNPSRPDFAEPKLVFVCDPKSEKQAVKEAAVMGIPVIGLCDTDNSTAFLDWVVPCNNKGKKSLALIFYLLAREFLKQAGSVQTDADFTVPLEKFEEGAEEQAEPPVKEAEAPVAEPAPEPEKKPKRKKAKKKEAEGEEEAGGEEAPPAA